MIQNQEAKLPSEQITISVPIREIFLLLWKRRLIIKTWTSAICLQLCHMMQKGTYYPEWRMGTTSAAW